MDQIWKTILWRQYGAAIDTLDDVIHACPDALWRGRLWDGPAARPEFWYVAYHTIFWIDVYLYGTEIGFLPPSPFRLIEQDDDGPYPERPYTKEELRAYLADCRRKCRAMIGELTDETAFRLCEFPWGEVTFVELMLYTIRHVQEHAAHLSLFLGKNRTSSPDWDWVARARE